MYTAIVYYLNLISWQQVICFKSLNLEQVNKYSGRLYLCLSNYHCNLNSKCNHLFHSLNIIECTLGGFQYIRVLHYICLKLTPLENH